MWYLCDETMFDIYIYIYMYTHMYCLKELEKFKALTNIFFVSKDQSPFGQHLAEIC